MPFIPATNACRVSINQRLHGQVVRNVMHVRLPGVPTETTLTQVANVFIAWWNDHLAPQLSTNITLESVTARSLASADAPGVEIAAPALSGGDLLSPAQAGNVAWAIRHKTGFTGRNRTGRSFVAGIPEVSQEGNEITLAVRDALVAAFTSLLTDLAAAGFELVVASFFDGFTLEPFGDGTIRKVPTPRSSGLLTPVTSFVGEINLDSQRRRLAGRGI